MRLGCGSRDVSGVNGNAEILWLYRYRRMTDQKWVVRRVVVCIGSTEFLCGHPKLVACKTSGVAVCAAGLPVVAAQV